MPASAIPREKIPWFPTVDYRTCSGDQECFKFCKNEVFTWDEENQHPIVTKPYHCVVGCQACINICPTGAITFPSQEELRSTMRRLRAEMQSQSTAPAAK